MYSRGSFRLVHANRPFDFPQITDKVRGRIGPVATHRGGILSLPIQFKRSAGLNHLYEAYTRVSSTWLTCISHYFAFPTTITISTKR